MLFTIRAYMYVIGYLIVALPWLVHAKLLEKDPARHHAYCRKKIVAFTQRVIKVIKMEVEIRGLENIPEEATLTVYNHQSLLDAFVLISHVPNTHSMVAKKELEKAPLLSNWMKAGDCIFIDREDPRAGLRCINRGAELVASGVNVTIAPEGTRGDGDQLLEFKGGAFKMATKAEAPILPIAIDGTNRIYEGNGKRLRPGKVRVTILPPVPTKGLDRAAQKELPGQVRAMIQGALDEMKKEN